MKISGSVGRKGESPSGTSRSWQREGEGSAQDSSRASSHPGYHIKGKDLEKIHKVTHLGKAKYNIFHCSEKGIRLE